MKPTLGLIATKKRTDKQQTFAMKCARKLLNVLAAHRRLNSDEAFSKAVREFEKLEETHKEDEIERVLDYYAAHVKDVGINIRSAKTFRVFFRVIKIKMEDETVQEVTPHIQFLVRDNLRDYSWPMNSINDVEVVAQTTYNRYCQFNWDLVAIEFKPSDDSVFGVREKVAQNFLEHLRSIYLYQSVSKFTVYWMRFVNLEITHWEGYRGDLKWWAWKPDHRKFVEHILRFQASWCGRKRPWDLIMEKLK